MAQRRSDETTEETRQRQQRDTQAHAQRRSEETVEETRQRQQRDTQAHAERIRNKTKAESVERRLIRQGYMTQQRAQQADNTLLQNQAEDNQDFSNAEVICHFEENYEEETYPHEKSIKFGEPGDMFNVCEHCGALKMKKIQGLRYAKGEVKKSFCCYNGNVVIDEEMPTPRAQEILNLLEKNL